MDLSADSSEIVGLKDESHLLRHFSRANQLRLKLRASERKSSSHPKANGHDRLAEAVELTASSRIPENSLKMGRNLSLNDKSKKRVKLGVSQAPEFGSSRPANLKKAFRKLCISRASQMAAIRRSLKLIGPSSVSDIGTIEQLYASKVVEANKPGPSLVKMSRVLDYVPGNSPTKATSVSEVPNIELSSTSSVSSPFVAVLALKRAKIRRAQGLLSREHGSKGIGHSKAKRPAPGSHLIKPASRDAGHIEKKGKQELATVSGNSGGLKSASKFNKLGNVPFINKSICSSSISATPRMKNHDSVVNIRKDISVASKTESCFGSRSIDGNYAKQVEKDEKSRKKGD